jgi:phosphoribosyl 1,2-cyclic phosphodiesterase
LDAIVLSHKHLDHSNDVNVMVEAMTQGGWKPRGALLAPRDAFEGEPVILPYVRKFVSREVMLEPSGGPYCINDVEIRTSLAHVHAVQTYGLHFRHEETTISYLPCGRFFEGLIEDYRVHAPDVLILNVLRYRDATDVDHLAFDDARSLIAGIRPRVAVMTHFGTKMLERQPSKLARALEEELNVKVFAAYDGWVLEA